MEVKSVGTFPVILVKLVPSKVEFSAKSVEMSAFLASALLGRVFGDDVLMSFKFLKELKADHKIAVRSRVLRYYVITWKGFFTQSQVLSSSIV